MVICLEQGADLHVTDTQIDRHRAIAYTSLA